VNAQSRPVFDVTYCPVVYNVQPTGVALDKSRNRLYVATPPQSGDSRFPPNSVVALDLRTGNVGPILRTGSMLWISLSLMTAAHCMWS